MNDRDQTREELLEYVEQFSEILVDSGMQRMPARVFTFILADDAVTYTAAELAEALEISLAAVSGAVRSLTTMGLLIKSRRPGTRADVYMLNDDDIWSRVVLDRSPLITRYLELASRGVDTFPPGPGRDRLVQTAEFMEFWIDEIESMRQRWAARLAERRAGHADAAGGRGSRESEGPGEPLR